MGRLANADERAGKIAWVGWNAGFWRTLQRGREDDVGDGNDDQSGHVSPLYTDRELRKELQDHNRTKAGHVEMEVLLTVDRIAGVLISARIAKGLTQRQLASMVGLKEQQIQRYEARDYTNVDLSRVQEIAKALIAGATADTAPQQALG